MIISTLFALLWMVQGIEVNPSLPKHKDSKVELSKTVPKRSIDAFVGDAGFAGAGWPQGSLKINGFSNGWNPWNSQ